MSCDPFHHLANNACGDTIKVCGQSVLKARIAGDQAAEKVLQLVILPLSNPRLNQV
jgi:hypothetical protein